VDFTYQTINSSTWVLLHLEERSEEWQIHEFILPLEILAIVPFDHRVFQLADPIGVTIYLEHSVDHCPLLAVVAVCQDCVRRWLRQNRREPLDRIDVYHALHVEQVNGYLDRVTLANLVDWLDVRSVHKLRELKVVEFKRILELFELLLLFLLVFVHPKDTRCPFLNDIHFVICAIVRLLRSGQNALAYTSLLAVVWVHVLATLGKFVLETRGQCFVEMVVLRVSAEKRAFLSLIKNFANENSVNSNPSFASKIHDAWVCVRFLEE